MSELWQGFVLGVGLGLFINYLTFLWIFHRFERAIYKFKKVKR